MNCDVRVAVHVVGILKLSNTCNAKMNFRIQAAFLRAVSRIQEPGLVCSPELIVCPFLDSF